MNELNKKHCSFDHIEAILVYESALTSNWYFLCGNCDMISRVNAKGY